MLKELFKKINKTGSIILFLLLLMMALSTQALATGVNIRMLEQVNVPNAGGTISDDQGIPLPVGSVVQIIQVVGSVDQADMSKAHFVGGDDIWIADVTVGLGTGAPGSLYIQNGSISEKTIYLRGWNATSLASATKYGNSATKSVTGLSPITWDVPSFATATSITPSETLTFNPSSLYAGDEASVVATNSAGTFTSATTFNFGSGIAVSKGSNTTTTYNLSLAVQASAASGSRSISASTGGAGNFTINSPSISSVSPQQGTQGTATIATITGVGTHFKNGSTTVVFNGGGITVNSATVKSATQVEVSITIDPAASATTRTVTVTTPIVNLGTESVTSSTAGFQVVSSSSNAIIDDFEGIYVPADGYYSYEAAGDSLPTMELSTKTYHETATSMHFAYKAASDSKNAWRGFGGILTNLKDITSYDTISFWMKGDGSTNTVKIQLKDDDGTNWAATDAAAVSTADTDWKEYKVPISSITKSLNPGADGSLEKTKIAEYQFTFVGKNGSLNDGVYIDYVTLENAAETPALSVNKTTLNFTAQYGGVNPNSQTVSVSNTGGGTLSWSTSDPGNWLSISPLSGTLGAGNGETLTFSVDVTGVATGDYSYSAIINSIDGGSSTIVVNLNVTEPHALAPKLLSADPASATQGTTVSLMTIEAQDTQFSGTLSVDFGEGITHGNVTVIDDTTLTVADVVLAGSASAGLKLIKVTQGSSVITGEIFTVIETTSSFVIDDFEGDLVDPANGYYREAALKDYKPTSERTSKEAYEKDYSFSVVYGSISDPANAWRLVGAVLNDLKDISSYNAISLRIKGDGQPHQFKFQLKDRDSATSDEGDNFASNPIDINPTTNWQEYTIPIANIGSRVNEGSTDNSNGTLDKQLIKEYQLVFQGESGTSGLLLDYVILKNTSQIEDPVITSIDPNHGIYGRETTFTLTGSGLGNGGEIKIEGQGITSIYKSSADQESRVSAWSINSIAFTVPRMEVGTKTISVKRTDGKESNTITFNVVASDVTGVSGSYNYPNPFNPLAGEITKIVFDPQGATSATAYIMDMTTRIVGKLSWTDDGSGPSEIEWNGVSAFSEKLGDGVYLYRVIDSNNKLLGKGKILIINK
ncbi:hypothetical protein A2230_06405 [candidate division WOR-1 bacterium RIFOXYA2_FULL_36_21]|uniref:BACON domain-containing protein n=1 Tax=candidate division WOR-1 bacterium RIFOXYB2_FULL_36_35 TaxID=1802578 RepID=A0A1F4S394_UNCSA|nr:MAG: hypothetical protein A2230_06405 [candidate division WOR-1 bacterium RIFOXYA2_FULL_36_21]OGC14888.1 MAG: hypothetical protein A2290_07305 [candidate division WOR-1 bacterium RIFOXYB2_FULL_36_35]